MSRVTEFPDEEERPSREEREEPVRKRDGGDDGGEGIAARLPNLSVFGRIREFYHDVKLEMRKTAWPTRSEVWSTTVVVLIAVVFFGVYLWGVDVLVALGFEYLKEAIK
ncbi:MAG TPA: preprotein translocase subunit SecE [Blastocatellia bacterium]|nr:preprotein translocase subunit SecE [Blastocatellia bacterium]